MLVMMDGLVNSLEQTKRAYYERYRLADVFASAKRVPKHILKDVAQVPGVGVVEGRISSGALIDLPGVAVPLRAQAISLPVQRRPRLNDIYLTDGRLLDPTRDDEILMFRGFASKHGLKPGSKLDRDHERSQAYIHDRGIGRKHRNSSMPSPPVNWRRMTPGSPCCG